MLEKEPRRNRATRPPGCRPAAPGGRCRRQWGPQRPGLLPGSPARRAPRRLRRQQRRGPGRSGRGAKLGAGREPRPPRTPQSRSRRLEPTSAETKAGVPFLSLFSWKLLQRTPAEDAFGFSKQWESRGHKFGWEIVTPSAVKNN
ncbi:hypothetical protein R6Z07F_002827 [Ovis aries]